MNINQRSEDFLHKEYAARMQRNAEMEQLACLACSKDSKRQYISKANMRRIALGLLIVILLVVAFADLSPVHASDGKTFEVSDGALSTGSFAFARGFNAMYHEEYKEAIDWFNKAVERKPKNASSHAYRAMAYYMLEDYETALSGFTYAIELSPTYASAYNWRGRTHLALEHYEDALTDTTIAINLEPEYALAYWTLGDVQVAVQQYEDAINSYDQYIALAGDEADPIVFEQLIVCNEIVSAG